MSCLSQDVMNATAAKLEVAANRKHPFGIELIQKASAFVRSTMSMEIVPVRCAAEASTFVVRLERETEHSGEWAPESIKGATYTLIAYSSGA